MATKNKRIDNPDLVLRRNYLVMVAKEILHMSDSDIAEIFKVKRQMIFSILRKGRTINSNKMK